VSAVQWKQFFVLQELDSQIDQLREELNLATLLADRRTGEPAPCPFCRRLLIWQRADVGG
jgi:hypothetical protein